MNELAIDLIKQHWPSLTAKDEEELVDLRWRVDDVADLAIRTCRCGLRLDGFDEYVGHLIGVLT